MGASAPGKVETAVSVEGQGPPLLLIHGAEGDRSMFRPLAALLSCNFTTIAYDQRDTGGTRNADDAYGLVDLADDAAALVHSLGFERVHVLGQSMGGLIAQILAARYPAVVDKLILTSSFALNANPMDMNAEAFTAIGELRLRLPDSAREIASYFFPASAIEARPDLIGIFDGRARNARQQARRRNAHQMFVDVRRSDIVAPTLVVAGSEDRLIPPSHTLGLADGMANARACLLPGLGHISMLEDPEAIAAVVTGFLETSPTGSRG